MNYNTEEEVWEDIKGYEGYYQVSNHGRIKSVDRAVQTKDGRTLRYESQIRSLHQAGAGYIYVTLKKDGKQKTKTVHRMVAEAFVPNPKSLPVVHHIDENKVNNHVGNLEWLTQGDNVKRSGSLEKAWQVETRARSGFALNRKRKSGKDRKPHKNRIPVIGKNVDTGEVIKFPSLSEARRNGFYNVHAVITGKRTHNKRFKWEYDN